MGQRRIIFPVTPSPSFPKSAIPEKILKLFSQHAFRLLMWKFDALNDTEIIGVTFHISDATIIHWRDWWN
jgi:hypothetical protein